MVPVPRVWQPAQLCSSCSYANDAGFKFCQACGTHNQQQKISEEKNDDYLTERRLSYLDNLVDSSGYAKKKMALQKEFEKFLFDFRGKNISSCDPHDVRCFLVEKDKKGKTQVHDIGCNYLGKIGTFPCSCSVRLSAGTVQATVGQLKSILQNIGRGDKWSEETQSGNPTSILAVNKYLKAIKLEQAKAHTSQKQAKPLFVQKLKILCNHLDSRLRSDQLSRSKIHSSERSGIF